MATINLTISGKRYKNTLPATFADLTRKQAIRLAECYLQHSIPFAPERGDYNEITKSLSMEQRFTLLQAVLNIPADDWFKLGELAIESLLQESLFAPGKHDILTGEPVVNKRQLPALGMKHSPLVQFVWAEEYYQNIQEGKPLEENLNGLVHILYSPLLRRLSMHYRIATRYISWDEMKTHNISLAEKFAVLQYYYGTRLEIRKLFAPMFSAGGGGEVGPDFTSKYRWWPLVHDLADKGVYGNFYETCSANLWDVLHHVSYNADKFKEFETKRKIKHG